MTLKTPNIFDNDFPKIRLSICQVFTEQWKVEDNYSNLLKAIDQAAKDDAEIAITPECVFHGYGDQNSAQSQKLLLDAAEPIDGEKISLLREKATANNMYILIGFAELGDNYKIYNSAALISNTGEIVYVYRKVHCRDFEDIIHDGYFTAGDNFYSEPLNLKNGTFNIGTMICFDRELPESVRSLRSLGSELIMCPLATNTSDLSRLNEKADNETLTRIRAAENEVFIVVVNHAGRFNGGSFIVGPSGETVLQLDDKPQVKTLDLPVGVISQNFHNNPLGWMGWGYRRTDVYNKYLDF
ncbi:MAG: carbon-nitrogen hydrolase family protein [Sedimentisphaeraceae bacterium JB056]